MYRLDLYSGASLLRTLYMNKPLLYSSCLYLERDRERSHLVFYIQSTSYSRARERGERERQ